MRHHTTRRLRTLVVLAALAVSMIAAGVPANAQPPEGSPGLEKATDARDAAPGQGGVGTDGWAWR